jgi:hypothetical protein
MHFQQQQRLHGRVGLFAGGLASASLARRRCSLLCVTVLSVGLSIVFSGPLSFHSGETSVRSSTSHRRVSFSALWLAAHRQKHPSPPLAADWTNRNSVCKESGGELLRFRPAALRQVLAPFRVRPPSQVRGTHKRGLESGGVPLFHDKAPSSTSSATPRSETDAAMSTSANPREIFCTDAKYTLFACASLAAGLTLTPRCFSSPAPFCCFFSHSSIADFAQKSCAQFS